MGTFYVNMTFFITVAKLHMTDSSDNGFAKVNMIFLQFLLSVAVRQVFLTSTSCRTNNLFKNTVRTLHVCLVVISTKHH